MEREHINAVSDLETAICGLGIEIEALNQTLRDLLPLFSDSEKLSEGGGYK
jgi:hypothetical protein